MPTDTHMPGTELVLETGIAPLDPGTDPVANTLRHDQATRTPCPGLALQVLLERRVPARVDIDRRDMAKAFAHPVDLAGVIGRVHEIVEVGHARGTHRRKTDRHLAVMDRCRGHDGAHRHAAIGRVEMQLVANPADEEAFGVLLGPMIAGARRSSSICPSFMPSNCRSGRPATDSFATSSPLRGRLRLRFGVFADFGFGAGFSRPSIAVESRET